MIDTRAQKVVLTIALQPFAQSVAGIAPTALAISADGRRLFVACGGINAVTVIDIAAPKLLGMIPLRGIPMRLRSALWDEAGNKFAAWRGIGMRDEPGRKFVHAYRGSVHVVNVPDEAQLASFTTVVAENNHMQLAGAAPVRIAADRNATPAPVPIRSGEPSRIEHIIYIIKENRTYDQVLGDLPQGNGDPSLVMFGRDMTPNHHKLAEEFVLLDNFYATGGNSADGHQWVTQANETALLSLAGYAGRSYPFDGSDPIAYAAGGFLWDYVLARNKTLRTYGEYVAACLYRRASAIGCFNAGAMAMTSRRSGTSRLLLPDSISIRRAITPAI